MSFSPSRTGDRDVDRNLDAIAKEFRAATVRIADLEAIDATLDRDVSSFRHSGTTRPAHYVAGVINGTALTTGAPSANTLRAFPLIAPRRGGTIDLLSMNVTTLLAGSARIGIYDSVDHASVLYPGKLLAGSDAISTAVAGVKTHPLSLQIVGGALYWLVHLGSSAATLRCCAVGAMSPILGLDAALGTAPNVGISAALSFAALPAIFPPGGAYVTAVPIPALAVRFSS